MKRKIAILVQTLTSGGAEKQSVLLARAMSEVCEVHYVVYNDRPLHGKYVDMLREDERICVTLLHGGRWSRLRQLWRYVKGEGIDTVFAYLTFADLLCVTVCRWAGARRVFTGLRSAQLPLWKLWIDRWCCNHGATAAICNCYSGKENFVAAGFRADKVWVIPNCYENIRPYAAKAEREPVRIITVGRFVEQKDYETALRAVARLRELGTSRQVRFVIVGYGRLESQIRGWIRLYGLEDVTEVHLNPPNIPELERSADIYLSTSIFEGTSNSIMEGMDADLPVVCTCVGDNARLVEEGGTGFLCDVGDVEAIAQRLRLLVDDRELRLAQGRRGKEKLQREYGVDVFRERYVDVMERKF